MPYEFPLTPSKSESPPCCFDGTLEKFLGFDTVGARGSELVFCRGNRPRPAASSTWEMLLLGFPPRDAVGIPIVPELTQNATIQLNERVSLRRCAVTISLADGA
jgi:hypothetical protein